MLPLFAEVAGSDKVLWNTNHRVYTTGKARKRVEREKYTTQYFSFFPQVKKQSYGLSSVYLTGDIIYTRSPSPAHSSTVTAEEKSWRSSTYMNMDIWDCENLDVAKAVTNLQQRLAGSEQKTQSEPQNNTLNKVQVFSYQMCQNLNQQFLSCRNSWYNESH